MRSVTVAQLRNRLSEYLRSVRAGETVTVLSRDVPVAQIVPVGQAHGLDVRLPLPGAPHVHAVPLPPPLAAHVDSLELLLRERGDR